MLRTTLCLIGIVVLFNPLVLAERFDIGTWRFEKEQFSKRHKWLPGFLVKRAMKTRLVISESTFQQFDDKGRLIDDATRPLEVLSKEQGKVSLRYKKKNEWVPFTMERRENGVYYVDAKGEYKLLPTEDTPKGAVGAEEGAKP